MARFSRKVTPSLAVKNLASGSGYRESAELELAGLVLTSFASDQFYRSANDTFARLGDLIDALPDKTFAARAGLYARNEFGMRSITHVLAAELGARVKGQDWTRKFYANIIRRPDDATEIVAYYLGKYGKPLPNAMKRGIGDALGKFDEYALAKYRGEGKDMKLVDLVNLIHPKPTSKNKVALKRLVDGTLASTETWESKLSKAGQEASDEGDLTERKADAWAELLVEGKLGYFALLRNLRNIAEQAPDCVPMALAQLRDPKAIKKSLVMPFRFQTAFDELSNEAMLDAISEAADIALGNIPLLDGDTVVLIDASGSMWGAGFGVRKQDAKVSARIAALFAVAMNRAWGADIVGFDTTAQYAYRTAKTPTLLKDAQDLSARLGQQFGGGTRIGAAFDVLNKRYDRIVILSDMQSWAGTNRGDSMPSFRAYCDKFRADPWVYSFDLQGYGQLALPKPKVACIAGFSEKVFDLFKMLEQDKDALIKRIKEVKF